MVFWFLVFSASTILLRNPYKNLLPVWISPFNTLDLHQPPLFASNLNRLKNGCKFKILEIVREFQKTNKNLQSEIIIIFRFKDRIGGVKAKIAIVEAKTKLWEKTISRLKKRIK